MSDDREHLFKLGERYFSGDGKPKDLKSALDYFRRSAELEYAPAQFQLGMAYDPTALARMYGIPGDEAVSFQWYVKAAQQGYPNAIGVVALAYYFGIKGAPQDKEQAAEWYAKRVPFGDTYAMMQLGLIAIERKQIAKGAEWLGASAELGDPLALSLYRSYVKEGVLPALDPQKEVALLESAADKGDVDAMLGLGFKYETGDGVRADLPKAYALLALVSITEEGQDPPGEATEGAARIKNKLSADELNAAEELRKAMHTKLSQLG